MKHLMCHGSFGFGEGVICRRPFSALGVLIFALVVMPKPALSLQSGFGFAPPQTSSGAGRTLKDAKSGVNFGNVAVGSSSSSTVTVTNNSDVSVTLRSSRVSGGPFSDAGLNLPATLGSGQSLSFKAIFAPTSTGSFSGSVTLSGRKSQAFTISLKGTGVISTLTLSLSPNSLSFGNTTVGSNSQLPVLVQNTGTGSVTISSCSVTGSTYTVSDLSLPATLSPGQNMSFTVTFTPSSTGVFTGSASLISTASTSPNVESLSGTGVSAHSVSLSWKASTSSGVLGYDLYRATTSGGPYTEITASLVSGTSYTDTTVSASETYYYVATAVTDSGESGYSNQAVATVP